MSDKHKGPGEGPYDLPDDLDQNPGIGQSRGMFAREQADDARLIEGANTMEGDAENDGDQAGAVGPELGRTKR